MEIAIQEVPYLPSQWEIKKTITGIPKSLWLQGIYNDLRCPAKEEKTEQARSISLYWLPHWL